MDYFYFVTTFFEPINISAAHIYHSALELSPVSSIARKLYYHRHTTPFPKIVVGLISSWDWSIVVSSIDYCESSVAWSPCGQFVVVQTKEAVEIRDALSFELVSTLRPTKPTSQLTGTLAYSPDGRSLACTCTTTIIIWDIQTGEVAKELQYDKPFSDSLVWSSDGRTIGTIVWDQTTHTFYCGVSSETTPSCLNALLRSLTRSPPRSTRILRRHDIDVPSVARRNDIPSAIKTPIETAPETIHRLCRR